jgi:hypothetical protein
VTDVNVPADQHHRGLRGLHPVWTTMIAAIVVLAAGGTLSALWQFISNGEWWNVPGIIAGSLVAWWVAVPAWRLARLGRSARCGPEEEPEGRR